MTELSEQQLVVMSEMISRRILARVLGGEQFDGDRKMWEILGYPEELDYDDYYERYDRQDIAGKIIDLPAIDTWRHTPLITDGEETLADDDITSPFLQGLQWLVDERDLWHYCQRVDRLAGIGHYGVLQIGVSGSGKLSDPVEKGSLRQIQDVLYFSCFGEGRAVVQALEGDTASSQYGKPKTYNLKLLDGGVSTLTHYTRCIHVAEDLLEDEVYGRPRLKRVYNRLNDLEKIIGGGSEATWKVMDRGMQADIRDSFTGEAQSLSDLETEINEYLHGLRRFIRTQGVDIKDLGSNVVDPSGLFAALISLVSASSYIPQRILIGSERGEMASTQDQENWGGVIESRQINYAEPVILRALIDRLVWMGALPAPVNGKYKVTWPQLYKPNSFVKAELADKVASAIQKISPNGQTDVVIDPDEFREKYLEIPPRMTETQVQVLNEEDNAV